MIRTEVSGGIRTAWRHRWSAAGVAFMITAACMTLTVVLSHIITETSVMIGAYHLRQRDAVTFSAYYRTRALKIDPSTEIMENLGKRINAGTAYTAVINNVELGNHSFAGSNRTVILIGDSAQEAVSGVELCSPAPCAMAGENIKNEFDGPLSIGDQTVPVVARMPSTTKLFDPNMNGIDLGTAVLINLPPNSLDHLDDVEQEEALTRTVLFAPTDEEVAQFARDANNEKITLVPHRIAADQPERYRDIMIRAGLYGLSLLALTTLVLFAYSASIRSTLRQERAELLLRHQYGATTADICLRVAVFLASTMLVLPTCAVLFFSLAGPPITTAAAAAEAALIVIYVVLLVQTTRRISRSFSTTGTGGRRKKDKKGKHKIDERTE